MSGESGEQAFVGSLARIDGEREPKRTAQGSGRQWDTENGGRGKLTDGDKLIIIRLS